MVRSALLTSLFAAVTSVIAGGAGGRVPGAFIIEFEDGHDSGSVMKALDGEATTRLKMDYKLFKGISVQLNNVTDSEEKAKALADLPAVKKLWPINLYTIPKVEHHELPPMPNSNNSVSVATSAEGGNSSAMADTYSTHVMTQVDKLREKGITGKGIKIAVIDTGIDYTHPALGNGCYGKGCLVSFGHDFVGDAYNGLNKPIPDEDPMDCGGHGTHVAGIIAAGQNPYGFTGAAPDVTLGAYRVIGCEGSVTDDIMIAAYNRAFEDGADIITASIGGASGWTEQPWAVAVSRIVEQGVPCTLSAGNEGRDGLFIVGAAATGQKATAVASFNNIRSPSITYLGNYTVDGGEPTKFNFLPGKVSGWGVKLPVYAISYDTTSPDINCKPLPEDTPDLSEYIVLIRGSACLFADQIKNVRAKGAKRVLFYWNSGGLVKTNIGDQESLITAYGTIGNAVGLQWVKDLKAGKKVVADVPEPLKSLPDVGDKGPLATSGGLSDFTSWGPTWEMDFKPQIGAPGGLILSTYPVAKGSYAVLSGTSMACPITAGIVALIGQVRGTFEPELMTDLMSATANPQLFNDGTKFLSKLSPGAQQGGGLVQAYDAAYTTSMLYPSSMSFNDTDHSVSERNFTITNKGKDSVTYKIGNVPALTIYTLAKDSIYPAPLSPVQSVDASASVKFSQDKVTLEPGHRAVIGVMATEPTGVDTKRLALWSGYVTVNGTDGSSLSMPYQGLAGSLHKSQVLAKDQTWIIQSNDTEKFTPVPANTTFVIPAPGTVTYTDVLPALYANMALGSPLIKAYIVPMTTCPPKNLTTEVLGFKTVGQPYGFPSRYNPRLDNYWNWDGRLDSGVYAPPGKYKFVTRALRIFGDESKDDQYDVSESTGFYIKYKE